MAKNTDESPITALSIVEPSLATPLDPSSSSNRKSGRRGFADNSATARRSRTQPVLRQRVDVCEGQGRSL